MNDMVPVRGQTARQDFSGGELTTRGETAAVAVAAQAKAAVEARYMMALHRPRDYSEVRVRLIKECKRPGFAAVARYQKPIGKDKAKWPKGPSIRFAEAALRCMTNCLPETSVIYDSEDQRIVKVSVTDLENNLTFSSEVVIEKTVERKFVNEGQETLGERLNSYGQKVYLVRATEDDLLNKQNALISKAMRTHALRLLPGDILDECMVLVQETLASDVAADPDAAKKRLIDAFNDIGVGPIDLQQYLGHSLERIQPAEIAELRQIYSTIKDGEGTWAAVMESRDGAGQTGSVEEQQAVREESARKRGFGSAAEAQKATEAKYATDKAGSTPATASTVAAGRAAETGERLREQPTQEQPEEPSTIQGEVIAPAKPVFGRRAK